MGFNKAAILLLIGIFVTICITVWICINERSGNDPVTWIPQGKVRGVNMLTYRNRSISAFRGIPFARPPIGNLRFKAPVPPDPWTGTWDASNDSDTCPQIENDVIFGNEDCLYLNVFTPRLPTSKNSKLLPVMLFVYGGAFKEGGTDTTEWGPYFLLDKDVVLVVPNYRMGVLGYLSTNDEVSPGNYGLKDLVRALEWNRDNIRYFGGDPNQVTLFGGSTGAMCVHLLTLSNSTKGLFHRYITHSGSALSVISQQPVKTYSKQAIRFAEKFGCPTNTSTLLVNCLRNLNASQIVDTGSKLTVWHMFPMIVWGPTVEPDVQGAFLTDSPANLLAAGKSRDLPWINTVSRDEGLILGAALHVYTDLFDELLEKIDLVLPSVLNYENAMDDVTAYTAALKSFYLKDLTTDRSLVLTNFTLLVGDIWFTYPAYRGSQEQLLHAKSPQYFCSFEYRGTFSYSYKFTLGSTKNHGTAHCDDLLYMFQKRNLVFGPPEFRMTEADLKLVDLMVQFWTSFATNGTPTTADPNSTLIWEPYSSQRNYLRIGNGVDPTVEVKYNFFGDRSKFWDELTAATSWN